MGTYQMQETSYNQSQASSPMTEDGFDYHANITDDENEPGSFRRRREISGGRVNSTYIKKYRFSRYKNAMSTFLPFRSGDISLSELPIDSVGCFTNSSFSWVRKYLISSKTWSMYKNTVLMPYLESLITNNKLRIPKPTFSDSCQVNGKRLLGLFKDEEQTRGRIKGSMFRVAWKFCSTRVIISSLIYALSIFIGLLGPVLFLRLSLESMKLEISIKEKIFQKGIENNTEQITSLFMDHYRNATSWNFFSADMFGYRPADNDVDRLNAITILPPNLMSQIHKSDEFLRLEGDVQNEQLNRVGFSFGFILCFCGAFFLRSVTNWLNLRTAARLRSAVLSSVYHKSVDSSVNHNISAHQILTLANEESVHLFGFVEGGALIIGTTLGVVFVLIAALLLLHVPGIWPIFGILLLFLVIAVLAKYSSYHFRRSMYHSSRMSSTVEEVCLYFKRIVVLGFEQVFSEKFKSALAYQSGSIRKSMIVSAASFTGGHSSAILLGGLYLNWCDEDIATNSLSVLILIVIYSYFLQNLVIEFGVAIQSILYGKATLDKVMNSYALNRPKPSKSRPPEPLVCSIRDAVFKWPKVATSSPVSGTFDLAIDEFFVPKNQIIGITGRSGCGKTTFLYSLLGHTQLVRGVVRQKGCMTMFPKEPLVIAGSLKENIIMGAEFNPSRYYTVVNALQLNEDMITGTDSDEVPIGLLELDREQLERISLARALYSDRQIFLFDEPLASLKDNQKAAQYLDRVVELLLQAKKTVVVATQSNHLLAKCQKIYFLDEGKIYKDGTYYEFMNVPGFGKMMKDYELLRNSAGFDENLDGCTSNAVSIVRPAKSNFNGRSRTSVADSTVNSAEMLLEPTTAKSSVGGLSIFSYFFLFFFYFVSSIMYYFLPLGFIFIVRQELVVPWLSYISIGVIIASIIFDMFSKFHLAFASEHFAMQHKKRLFKKLMGTTLNFLKTTVISDIVMWFNVDAFTVFQPHSVICQSSIAAFCSILLLVFANCWTIFLLVILLIGFGIICHKVRFTVSHLYHKECESRQKFFMTVTNHLRCRIVIQSMDRVMEFCKINDNLIEENTAAIFLRKSVKYHAQFLLNCLLGFGFSIVCLTTLLTPFSKLNPYRYILVVFSYYSLVYHLNRLLFDGILEVLVSNIKMEQMESSVQKIEVVKLPVMPETITNINQRLSMSFKDVVCKFSTRSFFELQNLHCQGVTGLTGKNSNSLVPILYRILSPVTGAIFVSANDLQLLCSVQLKTIVGAVLSDCTVDVTVRTFLDPNTNFATVDVTNALRTVNLFEKVQKSMDDSVCKLTKSERQLLGIAKCLLGQPKIIIFEHIHPEVQHVLDACIKKQFLGATILVIGRLESLGVCDKISEVL